MSNAAKSVLTVFALGAVLVAGYMAFGPTDRRRVTRSESAPTVPVDMPSFDVPETQPAQPAVGAQSLATLPVTRLPQFATAAATVPCSKQVTLENVPAGTTSLSVRSDGRRRTAENVAHSGSVWSFSVPTDCVRAERSLAVTFVGSRCLDAATGVTRACEYEWNEMRVEKTITVRR
jgi:hypothetical protein